MNDYRFGDDGSDLQALADYYEQRAREQAQAPAETPCEHSYNGRHSWVFNDPKDPDRCACRYREEGCAAEVNSPEPPRMAFTPNPSGTRPSTTPTGTSGSPEPTPAP